MNRAITVRELKEACDRLCLKGLGGKQILISTDDEGNGFHSLYYLFTTESKDIEMYYNDGMFHDNNEPNEVVLLG